MKIVKVIISIFFYFSISIQPSIAQSSLVDEVGEAVTDFVGSFMDNPYHHANSLKLYKISGDLNKILDEMIDATPLGEDFYRLLNMQKMIKSLEDITAGIAGRYPPGVKSSDFEIMNQIFDGFGWKRTVIFSTEDILFYEYRKDNFVMVLAKNIRPRKDEGDYNATSYNCYTWQPIYKEHYSFIGRVVFGDNYQFVECGDDETTFNKITKVTSRRGAGNWR